MSKNKTATPSGSQTAVETAQTEQNVVIRLQEGERPRRPRVTFTTDTVDNEGMGKKSSKGRTIFCQLEYTKYFSVLYLS